MRSKKKIRNYYDEYLEICRSVAASHGILDLKESLKKENSGKCLSLPFGTCLMDYSSNNYAYISDHCDEIITYSKDEYFDGGPDFHARKFHPDDKIIFTRQVFRDIREFWSHIPAEEISDYRFSFNHRYLRRDGTTSQLLQQSTYMEPDPGGIPVLNLLTFTDIGDFKTDTSLVLTVSRLIDGQGYVKVFSKSYPQSGNTVLSKRELEILKLCIDGMTSKRIADKLFLSEQTVKNHKRNMMAKTSASNIAALISLSLMNNWIF